MKAPRDLASQLRRLLPPTPVQPQPPSPAALPSRPTAQAAGPESRAALASNAPTNQIPSTWIEELSYGPVIHRRVVVPFTHKHGAATIAEASAVDETLLAHLTDSHSSAATGVPLYLDTETTGLGGGAGVYVFLIAIGQRTTNGFVIEQWLLRDLNAEASMLQAVAERIASSSLLVSFGGRSFDATRLIDRYRFLGMKPPIKRRHHGDLLTVSRALWSGRMRPCTLQAIERERLSIRRTYDVPGALCPQIYFHWLRGGASSVEPLAGVLHHNLLDVLTLPVLAKAVTNRARGSATASEHLGLGRHYRRRNRLRHAQRACSEALAHAEELTPSERAQAHAEYGSVLRRRGQVDEAVAAWSPLLLEPQAPIGALVELAIVAEHQLRDLALAEQATVAALSYVRSRRARNAAALKALAALEHRLQRIARKQRYAIKP